MMNASCAAGVIVMMRKDLVEKIRLELDGVGVVNTHEHTPPQRVAMQADESWLFNALRENSNNYNLAAAGMPEESWFMKEFSLKEAWKRLKPYINNSKSSPYYRSYMRSCRDLVGIDYDHIDTEEKWVDLSTKIMEANRRKDWYQTVMKKSGCDLALQVQRGMKGIAQVETELGFRPAINLDDFVRGWDGGVLAGLERLFKVTVESFQDYLDLLNKVFDIAVDAGVVMVKSMQGYERSLDYQIVSEVEAKRVFPPAKGMLLEVQDMYPLPKDVPATVYPASIDADCFKDFQDFVWQRIVHKAGELNMPVQIHTGFHTTWTDIRNVSPVLLGKLIRNERGTKFTLLHGGYPFSEELGQMARHWTNLYIDMAWMVDGNAGYAATKRVLSEWLELVPWFKITWGGDTGRIEEMYGVIQRIRRLLSEVLAEKVEHGWNLSDAIEIGKRILRENALELFKLKI